MGFLSYLVSSFLLFLTSSVGMNWAYLISFSDIYYLYLYNSEFDTEDRAVNKI
jgi:hypothetical protein